METRPTAAPDAAQAAVDRTGPASRGARVTLVVARARNGVIGRDNALPWHLPEDLKQFRRLTTGHAIVMGRRTYESIGRPLPSRRNVVVSRTAGFAPEGVEVVPSLEDALARCARLPEVFVIGGARLFRDALPIADRAVVTELDADFEGDTFFEPLDARDWQAAERVEARSASGLPYAIVTYQRRGRS